MPLEMIRNDITKMDTEAIVNAANQSLLGGSGVDGAIHKAAGPRLLEECRTLKGCKTGEAKITKGYDLTADYVIHTVGPVWKGGNSGEEELLKNCYKNSLALARKYGLKSISFPLISSGVYGYPKDEAMKVAIAVISDFLMENDMMVYMVVFDNKAVMLSEKLFSNIKKYIDDRYVDLHPDYRKPLREDCCMKCYSLDIEEELDYREIDDTFSEKLLKLIDYKGMTDSETYKKANISRKLFSKIRNNKFYQPSKPTVIAFSIALELNLKETNALLKAAGYTLSRSYKSDIIVEYFINEGTYNIFEINEALFAFGEKTLGI